MSIELTTRLQLSDRTFVSIDYGLRTYSKDLGDGIKERRTERFPMIATHEKWGRYVFGDPADEEWQREVLANVNFECQ